MAVMHAPCMALAAYNLIDEKDQEAMQERKAPETCNASEAQSVAGNAIAVSISTPQRQR